MSRDTRRYLIVVGLLLAALIIAALFVWLPGRRRPVDGGAGFTFASDIDNWRQTELARTLRTPYNFTLGPNLSQLPLELGNWRGEDVPQTNLEVFILLEPEQYVQRRYQDEQGRVLWLSLIGSRKSKSFHPPQICYAADNWTTQVSTSRLPLPEGDVYALRVDASKEGERHLVLYFYLWPDAGREPAAGTVLFKMTVPIYGTLEDEAPTLDAIRAFVGQIFTAGIPS